MIKVAVTWTDADEAKHQSELYFNMSTRTFMKMSTDPETMKYLDMASGSGSKDVDDQAHNEAILRSANALIKAAYGRVVARDDGTRVFQQKPEWTDEFMGSPECDALFDMFFWDGDKGFEKFSKFVENLIPSTLRDMAPKVEMTVTDHHDGTSTVETNISDKKYDIDSETAAKLDLNRQLNSERSKGVVEL